MADLTTEEKQELLLDLKRSLAMGALRVRAGDRDITYRSREDMKRIIADLEAELDPPTRPASSARLISFHRG